MPTINVPVEGTGTITVNGVFPVSSASQSPYLLLARSDRHQVSMLDLYTTTAVKDLVWWSAPIDGSSAEDGKTDYRTKKKRFRRMLLYGEGTLDSVDAGTVTFIADRGQRTEVYPVRSYLSDTTQDILVFQEASPDLVGRQLEVLLHLNGVGLLLREMQLEFVVLN